MRSSHISSDTSGRDNALGGTPNRGVADVLFPGLAAEVRALSDAVDAFDKARIDEIRASVVELDRRLAELNDKVALLSEHVSTQVQGLSNNVANLIAGFTRVDETLVAFGERMSESFGTFDRNVVGGIDLSVRTIWEAKAALSAELAHMPSQIAESGLSGGLGRSADGVPLNELLFPRAASDDVEFLDLDADVVAIAGADAARLIKRAAGEVVATLDGVDLSPMARNSPELEGIDWAPYIRASEIRVARVFRALAAHAPKQARVLDFGSYFGNFAAALAAAGYRVDALDAYGGPFAGALEPFANIMRNAGCDVRDVGQVGYDLAGLEPQIYDAVLFMGAIEHVPHTPRETLEAIFRVLKPSGVLLLDTPNLGYAYKRRGFVSGETVFPPIKHQFVTELPFFGHHREYLPEEVRWMLEHLGSEVLELDMYNYSFYGMTELRGEHLALARLMREHPQTCELIFAVARPKR